MILSQLHRLTATHKTELLLLALSGVFDISFGVEKLVTWRGHTVDPFWIGMFYLTLGLVVAIVGVMNLVRDVQSDCTDSGGK